MARDLDERGRPLALDAERMEPPGRPTQQALGRRRKKEAGERPGCRLAQFGAQTSPLPMGLETRDALLDDRGQQLVVQVRAGTDRDVARSVQGGDHRRRPARHVDAREPSVAVAEHPRDSRGEPVAPLPVAVDVVALTGPPEPRRCRARRGCAWRGGTFPTRRGHGRVHGASVVGSIRPCRKGASAAATLTGEPIEATGPVYRTADRHRCGQSDRRHPGDGTSLESSPRSTINNDAAMSDVERHEPRAGVVQLTLNRPDSLNAMTADMVESLHRHLDDIAVDPGRSGGDHHRGRARLLFRARSRRVRDGTAHRAPRPDPDRLRGAEAHRHVDPASALAPAAGHRGGQWCGRRRWIRTRPRFGRAPRRRVGQVLRGVHQDRPVGMRHRHFVVAPEDRRGGAITGVDAHGPGLPIRRGVADRARDRTCRRCRTGSTSRSPRPN